MLCFSTVFYEIHYVLLSLIDSRYFSQKETEKKLEEIKKELLESLVKERPKDAELMRPPENVINLQDAPACVTLYENQFKTKSHQYHVK